MAYFDLRLPLGWLFVIIGSLLVIASFYGAPVSSDGNSVGLNINLVWGVVLLAFGVLCLGTTRTQGSKPGASPGPKN